MLRNITCLKEKRFHGQTIWELLRMKFIIFLLQDFSRPLVYYLESKTSKRELLICSQNIFECFILKQLTKFSLDTIGMADNFI